MGGDLEGAFGGVVEGVGAVAWAGNSRRIGNRGYLLRGVPVESGLKLSLNPHPLKDAKGGPPGGAPPLQPELEHSLGAEGAQRVYLGGAMGGDVAGGQGGGGQDCGYHGKGCGIGRRYAEEKRFQCAR